MSDDEKTATNNSPPNSPPTKRSPADRLRPYWFRPGQSGNPHGRPKRPISDSLRSRMEEKLPDELCDKLKIRRGSTRAALIMLALERKAVEEGDVRAIAEIADRTEGKVSDRVEISGSEHEPLVIQVVWGAPPPRVIDAEAEVISALPEAGNLGDSSEAPPAAETEEIAVVFDGSDDSKDNSSSPAAEGGQAG